MLHPDTALIDQREVVLQIDECAEPFSVSLDEEIATDIWLRVCVLTTEVVEIHRVLVRRLARTDDSSAHPQMQPQPMVEGIAVALELREFANRHQRIVAIVVSRKAKR